MRPLTKNSTAIALCLCAMSAPSFAQEIRDNGRGEVSLGASYSTQYGAIAVLGFEGVNVGGSGVDASINYRRGETGEGGVARLRYSRDLETQRFGTDAQLSFQAGYSSADWEGEAYKSNQRSFKLGLSAGISPALSYSSGLFFKQDELSGFGAGTSPLISDAEGESTAAGLEFTAHIGKLDNGVLPSSGAQFDVGFTWGGLGDRKTASVFGAATLAHPIGTQNAAVLRVEAGNIQGLEGQAVSILDRAFLGASGGPRGFAFGSIGPRDFDNDPPVNSPLGGQRYSTVSAELRRDINPKLSIGVFADAGAVWDLGDAPVIGSEGPIDASRHMRASAGVAVYWDTALGKINLSIADPIKSQTNDEFNEVSISLMSSF